MLNNKPCRGQEGLGRERWVRWWGLEGRERKLRSTEIPRLLSPLNKSSGQRRVLPARVSDAALQDSRRGALLFWHLLSLSSSPWGLSTPQKAGSPGPTGTLQSFPECDWGLSGWLEENGSCFPEPTKDFLAAFKLSGRQKPLCQLLNTAVPVSWMSASQSTEYRSLTCGPGSWR